MLSVYGPGPAKIAAMEIEQECYGKPKKLAHYLPNIPRTTCVIEPSPSTTDYFEHRYGTSLQDFTDCCDLIVEQFKSDSVTRYNGFSSAGPWDRYLSVDLAEVPKGTLNLASPRRCVKMYRTVFDLAECYDVETYRQYLTWRSVTRFVGRLNALAPWNRDD